MNKDYKHNMIGMISVIVTFGFVAIVVMILCKSMFYSSASDQQKITGTITSTQYSYSTAESIAPSDNSNGGVALGEEELSSNSESSADNSSEEASSLNDADATQRTVAQAVYLRTGPNKSYESIATLSSGTVVDAYETENGWVHVKYGDLEGYVYNTYLG